MKKWYAVQNKATDPWDFGSYDLEEAIEMANETGCDIIAVIDEENEFCLEELHRDEDF